jgi:hypothetical protein
MKAQHDQCYGCFDIAFFQSEISKISGGRTLAQIIDRLLVKLSTGPIAIEKAALSFLCRRHRPGSSAGILSSPPPKPKGRDCCDSLVCSFQLNHCSQKDEDRAERTV